MKQLALLALLGLIVIGCSKNAPILPEPKPTPGPYDYRYGVFGQTRIAIQATEALMGNLGKEEYFPDTRTKGLLFLNADSTTDEYLFGVTGHFNTGIHITAPYVGDPFTGLAYQISFYNQINSYLTEAGRFGAFIDTKRVHIYLLTVPLDYGVFQYSVTYTSQTVPPPTYNY